MEDLNGFIILIVHVILRRLFFFAHYTTLSFLLDILKARPGQPFYHCVHFRVNRKMIRMRNILVTDFYFQFVLFLSHIKPEPDKFLTH